MSRDDRTTWWSRNWKWFVPTGCATVVLVFALGIVALVGFVFGMIKHTGAYAEAVARAKADPAVIEALGTPIEEGFMVSGQISETGPSGTADMSIPLRGPRGAGTLYVEAKKSAGRWEYQRLVFEVGGTRRRIDLLGAAAPAPLPDVEPPADAR